MKNFIAKTWAILSIFLLLGSFLFGQQLQDLLVRAPFMKIDPSFSGGEVERTIESAPYTIQIHEKVFPALIGEGDEGFRQITIIKNDSTLNAFNIDRIAVDSLTSFQINNDIPIVSTAAQTDTIRVVGLSANKLIFRIQTGK
ncbi:MAG: hypothetical protein J5595_06975 [Bacteroidales bacterium]|nr:hypothetical protein [Bacteroidales bacterium]